VRERDVEVMAGDIVRRGACKPLHHGYYARKGGKE
jgi:hypothetical protein